MTSLAERARNYRPSSIRAIFDAAESRPGVIRLEVGEPSFRTPAHIIEAGHSAAEAGFTRYSQNGGFPSLRKLLAEKIRSSNGFRVEPDNVVATAGGMSALYLAFTALLNPGDEVLMPTPGFPNMHENIRLLGAVPVFYELRQEEDYLPSLDRISKLISHRTRMLFLNTPSNPTGTVMPAELVEQTVALARRHDLWLLSDEVYDELVLDQDCEHISPARFDRDSRVISVYSFSKVYAMTGWRLGYAVANAHLADAMRDLQGAQLGCPNVIAQKAGEAALVGPREPIEHMRRQYIARRDLAWELVGELGLNAVRPRGAFYMMVDITRSGQSSNVFANTLLTADAVAVAPGDVFGPGGEGLIRVSLAADEISIEQGLSRIAARLALASGTTT